MKSSKERFLQTEDARVHADTVVQPWFIRAVDAALLQLQEQKTGSTMNGTEAAVFQFQLAGARQFVSVFESLSTKAERPTPPRTDSLPHPSI